MNQSPTEDRDADHDPDERRERPEAQEDVGRGDVRLLNQDDVRIDPIRLRKVHFILTILRYCNGTNGKINLLQMQRNQTPSNLSNNGSERQFLKELQTRFVETQHRDLPSLMDVLRICSSHNDTDLHYTNDNISHVCKATAINKHFCIFPSNFAKRTFCLRSDQVYLSLHHSKQATQVTVLMFDAPHLLFRRNHFVTGMDEKKVESMNLSAPLTHVCPEILSSDS